MNLLVPNKKLILPQHLEEKRKEAEVATWKTSASFTLKPRGNNV
tara:strand:+ start:582 stop:713 length:132 start_codon:yes stop_codon:yes gene_type:complete